LKHETATEYEQEQAALYALGALGQHEARAFENHLREHCDPCETEVSEFDEVIAILDQNTQEVTPPAYLRDLLTSRIAREAAGTAKIIPFPEQSGIAEHKQFPPKRSGGRLLVPWAIAASLAALALVSLRAWRVASDKAVPGSAREKRERPPAA
jgi:anti-sigma-K factor RskA